MTELVGRAEVRNRLDSLVDGGTSHGGTLVIVGEPGLGKTTLLDHAGAAASTAGFQVLRATGAQFETEIGFSGLHLLFAPISDSVHALGGSHAKVLATVLGSGSSSSLAPDRSNVAEALLALLRLVSRDLPTLMVVDDLHWLDRSSAAVLTLLARRLGEGAASFLGSLRPSAEGFFERAGMEELELTRLSEAEAEQLLDNRYPDLSWQRRRRVLANAMGNPLALVELPLAMSGPGPEGLDFEPNVVALNRRLEGAFSSRLEVLPRSTRQSLLLAALEGTGDVHLLELASRGRFLATLGPAERARLVSVNEEQSTVAFAHPLTRAAVVSGSTSTERRHAHRRLANVLREYPDRRAWHLARAVLGPDESAAASLEELSYRLVARGDTVGGVTVLANASALSPSRSDRARRLAAAAYVGAQLGGGLAAAGETLREARQLDPAAAGSLDAAIATSFVILNADGDVDTAHRILVGALDAVSDPSSVIFQVRAALSVLLYVCFFGARQELWPSFDSALSRFDDSVPAILKVARQTYVNPAYANPAAYAELDSLIAAIQERSDPFEIIALAVAGFWVDRLGGCRAALRRALDVGRDADDMNVTTQALSLLGFESFFSGQWHEADRYLTEADQLSLRHDFRLYRWSIRYGVAVLAAVRGDDDTTRQITDELLHWAVPRGVLIVRYLCHHARGLAALGRQNYEHAYRESTSISPAGEISPFRTLAIWAVLDVVEAAVRTNRPREAAAHVDAALEARLPDISGRTTMLVVTAEALVASSADRAAERFEQALRTRDAYRWPFELGRIEFLFGQHLRRNRAPKAAREHLDRAAAEFERLGAVSWAQAARTELRATGVRGRAQVESGSLTDRERLIAQMAAAGMSNKEIAEQLFVSARTVSAHLYRLFPKLGITSRAALRDALGRT